MKNVLRRILSLFMAFVVLVSTISMTVNKHYCSNILVDTSVFHQAKDCGMKMNAASTSEIGCKSTDEKSCCDNELQIIEGQDELQLQKFDFSINPFVFVAVFFQTYMQVFNFENTRIESFKNYEPPEYSLDRQVLNQVFLI